jgi:hypothetical protein
VKATTVALIAAGTAVLAGLALTRSAEAALPPSVDTAVSGVTPYWQPDAPTGTAPHPTLVTYVGEADVHGAGTFAQDTTGPTRTVRLADIGAPPDSLTSWALRLTATPIAASLLNDTGVDFHVVDVNPIGTDIRMGQGAVHDLYYWAGAAQGALAAEGNSEQALVVNGGMPATYPDRAPSGPGGSVGLEPVDFVGSVTSQAFDATGTLSYSGDVVAAVAAPTYRVGGGDFSGSVTMPTFSIELPSDVTPVEAAVLQPSMPGVDVTIDTTFPDAAQGDFHRLDISTTITTTDPWLQSRSVGPVREWTYQPYILNIGTRHRQLAAGLVDTAYLQARMRTGDSIHLLPVGGAPQVLGPAGPGDTLQLVAAAGHSLASLVGAPHGVPASKTARATSHGAAGRGSASGESATAAPVAITSPDVRGVAPAGYVSAQLADVQGVPALVQLRTGAHPYGDFAVPHILVDGVTTPITFDQLVAPPQITPVAYGTGAGFILQLLVATPTEMCELAVVATTDTGAGDLVQLFVLDVHATDTGPHAVDVDWYSRPGVDELTADGVRVPIETLTHEELNGGDGINHNEPDISAIASTDGAGIDYLLLAPIELYQGNPDGVHQFFALLRDHGVWEPDPVAAVNGEQLSQVVGVYMRTHYSALPQTSDSFRGWTYVLPVGSAAPGESVPESPLPGVAAAVAVTVGLLMRVRRRRHARP